MHVRRFSEEQQYHRVRSTKSNGYVAIVCLLHVLLWASLYVVCSTLYVTISTRATDETQLALALATGATGLMSMAYVTLHNLSTTLSRTARTELKKLTRVRVQWLATIVLRLSVVFWFISNGLSVTFTLARHPNCSPTKTNRLSSINVGSTCIVQRSAIAASLLALLTILALFIIAHKVEEPFRAHLLGIIKEQSLLRLILPYKTSKQRPMFSEMSFKCRSSRSLSSHTLVPSCDSATTLLPKKLEKGIGLGMFASKSSATFLAPRPSLSSIRTHTTIGNAPPSSPLPPLPAYFPEKYRKGSTMYKAVYPPRRPERSKSESTVRIVPSSPVLSITNLAMHNNSMESLSSVYSISISGESCNTMEVQRPGCMTDGNRSYSSGSAATIIKSPLGAMRRADRPDIVVMNKGSRSSSQQSATEINDVVTLQAMLPSVKAISEFGDVHTWRAQKKLPDSTQSGGDGPHVEQDKQRTWMPLLMRKTRFNGAMPQCHAFRSLV